MQKPSIHMAFAQSPDASPH